MDRDEVIITVYCLVWEHSQVRNPTSPLRRGGCAPALSADEVLTLELCGEDCKLATDHDRFGYCPTPSPHCLPPLTARTLFVRPAANLWQGKAARQQRVTPVRGQAAAPVQSIDPLPLPGWGYPRRGRARGCKPFAEYGHWAAKQLDS
jgi:hypothetical protein